MTDTRPFVVRTSGTLFVDAWGEEYMMMYPSLKSRNDHIDKQGLVIPFDGEAPPDWPVGTRVWLVTNPSNIHTVASTPFLYRDDWYFVNQHGDRRLCASHEPVPTTASVTLRVTGRPEDVESVRRVACRDGVGTVLVATGLSVEVLDD